jgi:site-specific DNA-methyltransferase (adenine-specific)
VTAAGVDWSDPFFESPEPDSIDGGTTSDGPLWHIASPRWGHAMHTMCSYHGMFPAKLAHYFIQRYSKPGDLVVDPFSGRGTVPLQARVEGRRTISNDLNPLGYVLSRAKANPPGWAAVNKTLDSLEKRYRSRSQPEPDVSGDIRMLYHPDTLKQLCFIRKYLLRRDLPQWSPEDLMLAGALAGIMHGAHRRDGSSQYLSISMPNTFSMSPMYVEKFIAENNLVAPDQNVFERIRDKLARLYLDAIDGPAGVTHAEDAAGLLGGDTIRAGSVDLLVTSPPYLQVVNYGTANWIRLWLLGVDDVGRERGEGRRTLNAALDHRHTYTSYKAFMLRILFGVQRALKPNGVAAIVIGDVADPRKEPLPLAAKLWEDVGDQTKLQLIDRIDDHLPVDKKVSRIWGDTKGQATDRDCVLVLAREGANLPKWSGEIDWEEPYKDGGPDAAHDRLRELRSTA